MFKPLHRPSLQGITPPAMSSDVTGGSERIVMCPPKYLSVRCPNNVFMKPQKVDKARAMAQYERIKNVIEALGVEILEITPSPDCQDQVYVANVGISLKPYIVLARYKADCRDCEVEPAREFFETHGYQCIQPPFSFEGEADLKKLNDKTYFGGWGQFTHPKALDWIEDQTGVKIIRLHEINPKAYHLDCSVSVVNENTVIIGKAGLDAESIKSVEKVAEVIFTPKEFITTGITNSVLVSEKEICLSGTFNPEIPEYRNAMEWMNETFDRFGYTCVFLDTDEFDKSGADLSCAIFHLDFLP